MDDFLTLLYKKYFESVDKAEKLESVRDLADEHSVEIHRQKRMCAWGRRDLLALLIERYIKAPKGR